VLVVKDLDAYYDTFEVLFGVNLTVEIGQWVSLIGTNGAGKTTLLNSIVGLHKDRCGQVFYQGQDISQYSTYSICRMNLGYMAEGHPIFNTLTVKENLELGGIGIGLSISQQRQKMEEIFDLFPLLKDRSSQRAGTFSGGEQQLLALGRCLMASPQLILCDEPTLGLSPVMVGELFKVLKLLHQRGTAILLVEQNVEQALFFCDYAYVLDQGVITLSGTGQDLLKDQRVQKAYLGY
jgi:branched-chain amino acid transport system ATP-binding protein